MTRRDEDLAAAKAYADRTGYCSECDRGADECECDPEERIPWGGEHLQESERFLDDLLNPPADCPACDEPIENGLSMAELHRIAASGGAVAITWSGGNGPWIYLLELRSGLVWCPRANHAVGPWDYCTRMG